MSIARFFLSAPPCGESVFLTGTEAHHLLHVMRLSVGEKIILFDNSGCEYLAEIVDCQNDRAQLTIVESCVQKVDKPIIHLAQGLLKSKSWDLLLQKISELGVDTLIPLHTDHAAAGANTAGRRERWQKVAVAAAKQCGRNLLLNIAEVTTLEEVVKLNSPEHLVLLAHNDHNLPLLKTVLNQYSQTVARVTIVIGPEGGFSEKEIALTKKAAVSSVLLAKNILRAETAALVAIVGIRFFYS